ncbi:AbrB/MazE/SpoVT family DNA-binding domain-containing protein [Fictibacillus phosphorivorans]|nr:AbrB/MazE/SpoVT family DNA-binding domain-containing protein [Fictibacillus phosphorivorans]
MSISVTREMDHLGRIVIPKEIRRNFGIEHNDPMEIFIDGEQVVLKKYVPNFACAVTGKVSSENKKFGEKGLILSPEGIKIILEQLEQRK